MNAAVKIAVGNTIELLESASATGIAYDSLSKVLDSG